MALHSGVPGPLPFPSSPTMGSPRWGPSEACWWHSPPSAQGDAVLMASPAAAPPRWESLGQQALGEQQDGDKARARVFPPKTSLRHLPAYFYQPGLPSSPEAAPHQHSNGDSSARPRPRVSPSSAPKPSPVPSCYAIPCQRVPEPAQRPPRHRLSFALDPAARSTNPPPPSQRHQRHFFFQLPTRERCELGPFCSAN